MKAEDLMVGNWVYHNILNRKIKVGVEHQVSGDLDYLEPIPITEENIVELLGFKCYNSIVGLYFEKLNIKIYSKDNMLYYNGYKIPLPKHVHKLQQLIKALEE